VAAGLALVPIALSAGESVFINNFSLDDTGQWRGSCIERRLMEPKHTRHSNHYVHLGVMALLSFLAMYALMYSMVDSSANVYMSFNQAYMAALMAAPMIVIELIVMRAMYKDARLNQILIAGSVFLGIGMFLLIRQQTAIGDRQFLRSMIPHHSGAILMCREATITDPELKALCQEIVVGQQREIDQMTAKLSQLP
jgi:hypothetical protein